MNREEIEGISNHAVEAARLWHKAMLKATTEGNDDAVNELLAHAPKVKRVFKKSTAITGKLDAYVAAEKATGHKFVTVGNMEQDLEMASLRASSMRKANSLHRFIEEVETL